MPVVAAKYADGINFYNGVDSEVEDMLRIVGARCEEQGRDVSKIKRSRCLGVSLMDRPFDLDLDFALLLRTGDAEAFINFSKYIYFIFAIGHISRARFSSRTHL